MRVLKVDRERFSRLSAELDSKLNYLYPSYLFKNQFREFVAYCQRFNANVVRMQKDSVVFFRFPVLFSFEIRAKQEQTFSPFFTFVLLTLLGLQGPARPRGNLDKHGLSLSALSL